RTRLPESLRRAALVGTGDRSRRRRRHLARIARARQRLQLLAVQQAVHLVAVDGLALEQRLRQQVQLVEILAQQPERLLVRLLDDVAHLGVDEQRGLLAVVLAARDLLAEEDHVLALAERERAEL